MSTSLTCLYTVSRVFESVGLRLLDVEQLSTHGGSLRVFGCHEDDARATTQPLMHSLRKKSSVACKI